MQAQTQRSDDNSSKTADHLRSVEDSRTTAEQEIRAKAAAVVAQQDGPHRPETQIQLNSIWHKDHSALDLPDYVKRHSTTMSFPEKASLPLLVILHCLYCYCYVVELTASQANS